MSCARSATGLYGADVPVENSKGEADPRPGRDQRHATPTRWTMADRHAIIKNACKEIAWLQRPMRSASWQSGTTMYAGNSSHIHQSLWSTERRAAVFHDARMPTTACRRPCGITWPVSWPTPAKSPTSWRPISTPTSASWPALSPPPRRSGPWTTARQATGCAGQTRKAVRVECRVGGADLNPYLAFAALIAAGLDGIEKKMELEPAFKGDAYGARRARSIPETLRDATAALKKSKMLRSAFGDEVINHYVRAAEWEQEEYDRRVTDWEVNRGFERA